jgi:hypothetical protein
MGVLEDAIREHLELKRKHGADEQDLRRQEAEALGPARRELRPREEASAAEPPAEDEPAVFDEAGGEHSPELYEPATELLGADTELHHLDHVEPAPGPLERGEAEPADAVGLEMEPGRPPRPEAGHGTDEPEATPEEPEPFLPESQPPPEQRENEPEATPEEAEPFLPEPEPSPEQPEAVRGEDEPVPDRAAHTETLADEPLDEPPVREEPPPPVDPAEERRPKQRAPVDFDFE